MRRKSSITSKTEGNYENVETMRTREVLLADTIVRKFYWSNEIMELLKIVYGIDFSKKENNEKRE